MADFSPNSPESLTEFLPDDILCLDAPQGSIEPGWYMLFHTSDDAALLAVAVLQRDGQVVVTDRMVRVSLADLAAFRLVGSLIPDAR